MIPKSTCCGKYQEQENSFKVTNDKYVHDSKALPGLIENIIKSDSMMPIGKLITDDAYMMVIRFLNYRLCFS
jgi:hypothetical protein